MLLILLVQVGKNSFGLTGTMRTLNYFNTVKLNPSTLRQMPLEPWKYSLDLFWFSYMFVREVHYLCEGDFMNLRERFYVGKYDGKIKQRLHGQLKSIYEDLVCRSGSWLLLRSPEVLLLLTAYNYEKLCSSCKDLHLMACWSHSIKEEYFSHFDFAPVSHPEVGSKFCEIMYEKPKYSIHQSLFTSWT